MMFMRIAKANCPVPILSFEYIEKKENDSESSFLLKTTINSSFFTRLSPKYLLNDSYSKVLTFLSDVLSKNTISYLFGSMLKEKQYFILQNSWLLKYSILSAGIFLLSLILMS